MPRESPRRLHNNTSLVKESAFIEELHEAREMLPDTGLSSIITDSEAFTGKTNSRAGGNQ